MDATDFFVSDDENYLDIFQVLVIGCIDLQFHITTGTNEKFEGASINSGSQMIFIGK